MSAPARSHARRGNVRHQLARSRRPSAAPDMKTRSLAAVTVVLLAAAAVVTILIVVVAAAMVSCCDAAAPAKIKDDFMMLKRLKLLNPVHLNPVHRTTAARTVAAVNERFEELHYDVKNFTVNDDLVNSSNGTLREDAVVAVVEDDDDDDDDDDAAASAAATGGTSDGDGTLSAVWYLAAFGGLVMFFFVVTCSELFLDNPVHARRQMDLPHAGHLRRHYLQRGCATVRRGRFGPETPPPPYHLFAPPSYDDFVKGARPWDKKQRYVVRAAPAPRKLEEEVEKKTPDDGNNKNSGAVGLFIVPVHGGSTASVCSRKVSPEVVAEMKKQLNAAWKQPGGKGDGEE